ncbi:MAG TPA: M48 family metalloprotease, partial [Candidatus Sumerlaeia bacterium]|nr:M48 family metalloprotease [Candidatus Sumerlaeia bacterium]
MEERRTFYQIQEQQTHRTIWLFIGLILFYFIGVGILYALIAGVIFSALLGIPIFSPWHFVIIFVISALLAIFQWENAKTSGAEFILEKLRAAPLDTSDLYHKKLGDIVEEVRIGAGCKKSIRICVIPANSVNTCAIIGADGVPIIAATEGALARFTREELQSAIAHELAHIMSGDALYITFACALGNIFQRLSDMLEIEEERPVFFNTWMQRPEGRQMELLGQTISGALAL